MGASGDDSDDEVYGDENEFGKVSLLMVAQVTVEVSGVVSSVRL